MRKAALAGDGAWWRAVSLLVVLAALPVACAKARNYLDPEGPRYVGGQGVPPEPSARRRRIVTFNIEYAMHVDRAIVALREHPDLRGADVLALQEMDAPGVEAIAKALGMNYAYYPAALHPKTHRDVGEAVLSPWPIEKSWKLPLPHQSRVLGQARAAVGVILRLNAKRIRVYALHLGSPLGASGGQRRDQAEAILADARSSPDPVVIAGDFNSHGIGRLFESRGYVWVTRTIGPTAHDLLDLSFDHVFVFGFPVGLPPAAGVARDVVDASDHRPVWALVGPE